jgi:16S rRNA processing protein RimM
LVVGRITRPHGVRGEVRARIHTDDPGRFTRLTQVWVGENSPECREVERVRFHQRAVILKLLGVDTRDQAEALRDQWLQVPIDQAIPLQDGEYYLHQLIGLRVETTAGAHLGDVTEILQTGANDVFVVGTGRRQVLLPDIPGVVLEIRLAEGRVLVEVPAGLIDT